MKSIHFSKILKYFEKLNDKEKLELINNLSATLSENEEPVVNEPLSHIKWIPIEQIIANTYNPNNVAVTEKRLLLLSMINHGITCPLIVRSKDNNTYELIDGFHRFQLIKKSKDLKARLNNKVPVVVLDIPEDECIVATIRHNRARGKHQIDGIANVVKLLAENAWSTERIMKELGMEADEVLRLKQFNGLAEKFKDSDYSNSWV
jgi:ParB-like chromosome segregation protein Spo0J